MNDKILIINSIKSVIAEFFQITEQDLKNNDRRSKIVYARHIGMYLSRKLTNEKYPKIGLEFGGRDPQTAKYAYKKISTNLKDNKTLKSDINEIINIINFCYNLDLKPNSN